MLEEYKGITSKTHSFMFSGYRSWKLFKLTKELIFADTNDDKVDVLKYNDLSKVSTISIGGLHISGYLISEQKVIIGARGQKLLCFSLENFEKTKEISVKTNTYAIIKIDESRFMIGGVEGNIQLINSNTLEVTATFKISDAPTVSDIKIVKGCSFLQLVFATSQGLLFGALDEN